VPASSVEYDLENPEKAIFMSRGDEAPAEGSRASRNAAATSGARDLLAKTKSRAFRRVLAEVAKLAAHESVTIVFQGETGTGKNWLARLVHDVSPRHAEIFRQVPLAALSDSLIESELFGHEKGAYTDAHEKRLGAFQIASHGTVFLDELNKASLTTQRHLLQVIEERTFSSLGADRVINVDVRIVAATSEDLEMLVSQGSFLKDLHARVGWFTIQVPALRNRREDIPDLAKYFVARHASQLGYSRGLPFIHPELMASLKLASWPYNLRDLDNAMHQLVIAADGEGEISFRHCDGRLACLRPRTAGRPHRLEPEKAKETVKSSKSIAAAARDLDVSRSTLYRMLPSPDSKSSTKVSQ
jgi:DNA-binding NtrC family response regulator